MRVPTSVPTSVPKTTIHIVIGIDEFTDTDIRERAKGNIDIDESEVLLIKHLSQIIVDQILEKAAQ